MASKDWEARFWIKVFRRADDACWLWLAGRDSTGYGQFWLDGGHRQAHIVAYELLVGPVPAGHELDHVAARGCLHRHCVNPAHLEPVLHVENVRRGRVGETNRTKTHCPENHPLSGENLYEAQGRRHCRACRKAQRAARYVRTGR